jgi:hypothetical protein
MVRGSPNAGETCFGALLVGMGAVAMAGCILVDMTKPIARMPRGNPVCSATAHGPGLPPGALLLDHHDGSGTGEFAARAASTDA